MVPPMGCCDDFTRSHLVRGSIARAGAGLPVIEPGMPIPAAKSRIAGATVRAAK